MRNLRSRMSLLALAGLVGLVGLGGAREVPALEQTGVESDERRAVPTAPPVLTGRVTGPGGEAVAGARVRLTRLASLRDDPQVGGSPGDTETVTGADGRFTFPRLGLGRWAVSVAHDGYAERALPAFEVAEGGVLDLGTIELRPGADLAGRISDPGGRPIEGAEVAVTPVLDPSGFAPRAAGGRTESDGEGRFLVRALPLGVPVRVEVRHEGFLERVLEVVPPLEAPLRVTLQPGGRIAGRVLRADGEPAADASVAVDTLHVGAVRRTYTDELGAFELAGVPPGPVTLRVNAPGHLERTAGLEVRDGEAVGPLEIRLEAGVTVVGRVLSPRGEPVPGVGVVLRSDSPGFPPDASTDDRGAFELHGVTPGTARVVVEHELGDADVDIVVRPGGDPLVVELDDRGRIEGRVATTDGEPVADAWVSLVAAERPPVPAWGNEDSPYTRHASTDSEGRFRFRRLRQGRYQVHASAAGLYSPGPSTLELGGPIEGLELVLAPGEEVAGRLLGVPADQLATVRIVVTGEGGARYQRGVPLDPWGRFRLEGLAPGRWTVQAIEPAGRRASGEVEVVAGGGPYELELDLSGGFELRGSVRVGGEPLAFGTVHLSATGGSWSAVVQTGADGGFSIAGLEPGPHRLTVRQDQVSFGERTLELTPGDEVHLDLETAALAGRVLDADGAPAAGGKVYLLERADRWPAAFLAEAVLDGRGSFELPRLAPGEYDVSVAPGDGQGQTVVERVSLSAGERRDLELQLEAGGELVLIPLLPSGHQLEILALAVLDDAGALRHAQSADRSLDGTYRFSGVPKGDLRIVVHAYGTAWIEARATVPGPPVSVPLPPATKLAVEVAAPEPPGDHLSLTFTGGDGVEPPATISRSVEMSGNRGRIDNLPPGTWTVRATSPDGREWRGTATTAPDRPGRLVLE